MSYLILGALLLGAMILWLWIRHHSLKSNYEKNVDIGASLLLAKERFRRRRMYGSIIFQLKSCPGNLAGIHITSVRGLNEETVVRDFGRLYFDLDRTEGLDNILCSVSVSVTDRVVQRYRDNEGAIFVRGILRFVEGIEKKFAAKLPVELLSR